ncbi:MAG: 5-bromo-4-chloroindolyl phosphate hydrolysis family protein [Lachnospiraceae bacterium]|jgi:5-bromo-4-chloroindolyl phosphate hydrolysis protein
MPNQDWYDLGDEIGNIVQEAIDSQNFSRLNQTINQTIGRTINTAMDGVRMAGRAMENVQETSRRRYTAQKQEVPFSQRRVNPDADREHLYYKKTTVNSILGYAFAIIGGITSFGLALSIFIVLLVSGFAGDIHDGLFVSAVMLLPLLAVGLVFFAIGCRTLGWIKRFKRYCRALGKRTYCDMKELAQAVGKSEGYVRKDLQKLIEKGMFCQGHIDRQSTCLMVSDEAYQQYLEAEEQLQKRNQEAAAQQETAKNAAESREYSPEVQKVLEKGRGYIRRLRECNDAIPGEVISNKISHTELLTAKIFQCVEQDPSVVSDLRRLMEYYLPTTIKLLEAYEELDAQPIQGENIANSKKEIEDSLDTINIAFEKLLDSLFEEKAWDVSSDISVLKSMLAQEGLTGTDFNAQ